MTGDIVASSATEFLGVTNKDEETHTWLSIGFFKIGEGVCRYVVVERWSGRYNDEGRTACFAVIDINGIDDISIFDEPRE